MEALNLKTAVQDSVQAGAKIIKGEFNLAKGEAKKSLHVVKEQSRRLVIAGVLGAVAALYGLAFIFAGLGALLGSYWLSGLILFVVIGGISAFLAMKAIQRLKEVDYSLTETRRSLQQVKDILPAWGKTFVNRTSEGLEERRIEKAAITPPPLPPEMEISVAKTEVKQGRQQWFYALREFEELFDRLISTEQQMERVVKDGARGAAYVLPVLAVAYLGYWIAGRRKEHEMKVSHDTIPNTIPTVVT